MSEDYLKMFTGVVLLRKVRTSGNGANLLI